MKQEFDVVQNGSKLSMGTFSGEQLSDSEVLDEIGDAMLNGEEFVMDERGVIHRGDTITGGGNGTKISEGTFAVPFPVNVPTDHSDQWYVKNPALFRAEVANMQKHHPKAKYGFMPQSGDMYWVLELKIGDFCKPWQFMLRYMKDHPNNNNYGGSIRVLLMKSPTVADLKARASAVGRPGVPHLLSGTNVDGQPYTYLCTRTTADVESGSRTITSAVQVAAWAGDWALHFEVALQNDKVWNAWCNDAHFRHLMVE